MEAKPMTIGVAGGSGAGKYFVIALGIM